MFDGQQLGETIAAQVRSFLEREVAPLKAENVELKDRIAALEARPLPEKGDKGDPGERGEKGKTGDDGKDGRGVKDLLIDREGCLVATMDDGELKSLGRVVGKKGKDGTDGKKGKDGRDGLGFDDMDVCVLDDDRTIELSFKKGEEEKAFTLKWPTVIYRGTYKHDQEYSAGDAVTWGGHMWIAEKTTSAKPDQPGEGWRLAVKKGRDGRDAK